MSVDEENLVEEKPLSDDLWGGEDEVLATFEDTAEAEARNAPKSTPCRPEFLALRSDSEPRPQVDVVFSSLEDFEEEMREKVDQDEDQDEAVPCVEEDNGVAPLQGGTTSRAFQKKRRRHSVLPTWSGGAGKSRDDYELEEQEAASTEADDIFAAVGGFGDEEEEEVAAAPTDADALFAAVGGFEEEEEEEEDEVMVVAKPAPRRSRRKSVCGRGPQNEEVRSLEETNN